MKSLKNILVILLLVIAGCKTAQKPAAAPTAPSASTPTMPKPVLNAVGITKPQLLKPGYASLDDYIAKDLQYPDDAKKNNIQGTILVSATLDTTGVLKDVKADNDLGHGTAAAAEKVVQSMSPMSPAGNNGKVVRFHMKVPVNFTLNKAFSNDSEEILDKQYGQMPDIEAQYPGGAAERDKFIQANVKIPADMQVSGTIVVTADVEASGSLTHVRVLKPGIPDMDAAAIQVIKAMPKWIPAQTLGHPVQSQVVIMVDVKK